MVFLLFFFSFEDVQTRPSQGQSSGGWARIDGYELDAKYPYSCFLASSFLLVRSYLAGGMRLAYQQSAGSLTSFCSCSGLGGFGLGSHVEWPVGWLWGVSERTWKGDDHIASVPRPPLCIELNCAYPVGCEPSLICADGASRSQMKEGASAAGGFCFRLTGDTFSRYTQRN